jgi:hypothetical protein
MCACGAVSISAHSWTQHGFAKMNDFFPCKETYESTSLHEHESGLFLKLLLTSETVDASR